MINQTFIDIKIICVDDGSIDNSLSILKKYQKWWAYWNITSKNKRNGFTRNYRMKIVKGKYVLFLDNDDFFKKKRFNFYLLLKKIDIIIFKFFQINYK